MKSATKISLLILTVLLALGQILNAQAQSQKIIFAVIGDYGLAGQNEADVANLVKGWNPDFIVTVGDNNYPGGAAWSIDQNIGQYYHEYIFPYIGKYGNGSTTRRFFPVLGNHDWGESSAQPYFNYFGFRNQQSFYDFVQGPLHFFMLDSDKNEPEGVTSTSLQARWLKKSLATSTSPFNIVVFHHAAYSSGWHGSTLYMRWPFKEWGADVILTGHDHIYERLIVDGIPYFVNGIGGEELYNVDRILPESQVRFSQDFGAMRVEASSATMKFQMITRAGVLVDEYNIGQSYPSIIAISPTSQSPINTNNLNFQVTFSESVTGVDITDFTLSSNINDATFNNVSGTGNVYVVSVNTGNGDGTIRLDVTDNDSIINGTNNSLGGLGIGNGNYINGQTAAVDKSVPRIISILRASPNPTNVATVDYSVTFSEPVSSVDIPDFGLQTSTGAQINSVGGSGSSYLVSITTNSGEDVLRLDFIDNDSVTDFAGNTSSESFSNGETYTVDRSMPYVVSILRAQSNEPVSLSVDYIVSFSEAVVGVDRSDFSIFTSNNAILSNIAGAGSQYSVSISSGAGNSPIRLDLIDDGSIFDKSGNQLGDTGVGNGNFSSVETYITSQDVPNVTSIMRAGPNPTNAASVDFLLTFSEPVEGVDLSDFGIAGDNAVVLNINNANPFYIVTVDAQSNNGTLKLDLIDDDTIHNLHGVMLGGNGIGNANFTTGEAFSIDRTAPQVTSIVRAGPNPTISSNVDFIVTFSESVAGVDLSDFYAATTNLNSSVTKIQNADPFYIVSAATGIGTGELRLDLVNNGSITDQAGNRLTNSVTGDGSFVTGEIFSIAKITINFPAPNLLDVPRNPLTNNPFPHFSWSSVRNALAYELFIAQDSNFSQIVLTRSINQTSFSPSSPLADGAYYIRVRAYNAESFPGNFSKIYALLIDTMPPPTPILVSPANDSTSTNRPLLEWQTVDGAALYQVELDNSPDFSSPEFRGSTSKTTLRPKPQQKARNYYWHVRARDKAGNWSNWSPAFKIQIP